MSWRYLLLPAAYLLGSLNTSIVLSKFVFKKDVRSSGSGNAGMTNMTRSFGKGVGALVLLMDALKGVAAVLLARWFITDTIAALWTADNAVWVPLIGYCMMMGHIFPVFFGFKGGKGIATTAGVLLALDPLYLLILVSIFMLVTFTSRYVSLGSLTVAVLYPVVTFGGYFLFHRGALDAAFVSILFAVTVIWMHRENIKRLLNHSENKLGSKKK